MLNAVLWLSFKTHNVSFTAKIRNAIGCTNCTMSLESIQSFEKETGALHENHQLMQS